VHSCGYFQALGGSIDTFVATTNVIVTDKKPSNGNKAYAKPLGSSDARLEPAEKDAAIGEKAHARTQSTTSSDAKGESTQAQKFSSVGSALS
jgi:hypothetical protein